MTKQKQMTEQELDQVSGGPLNPDSMMLKQASRSIIVPHFKVGRTSSNPTPHPAPVFRNVRGVVNPDSM